MNKKSRRGDFELVIRDLSIDTQIFRTIDYDMGRIKKNFNSFVKRKFQV